jgi:ubiquitin-protein ligase
MHHHAELETPFLNTNLCYDRHLCHCRHYVIRGPPDTPYHNGWYWGKLIFPSDYPFKPPSIRMSTPSGRFQTDTRLCLTMSDFHPSSWNPSWSVATILNGLLSFMVTDETTTGSIKTTDAEKRIYAARSHKFNTSSSKFRGENRPSSIDNICPPLPCHFNLTLPRFSPKQIFSLNYVSRKSLLDHNMIMRLVPIWRSDVVEQLQMLTL